MDVLTIFAILAGVIIIGFFADVLFKKVDIPDVLVLIIVGIFIGYFFSVDIQTGAELFTTFALIFILFQGGLQINFKTLFNNLPKAMALGVFGFLTSFVILFVLLYFIFQFDMAASLLLSAILGGTSSAVIIPLLNRVSISEKHESILTIESTLNDILCILVTVSILQILQDGFMGPGIIAATFFSALSTALFFGIIFGIIWIYIMYNHQSLVKSHLVTIAVMMILFVVVESTFVSGNGAVAALTFGLMLGNSNLILRLFVAKEEDIHSVVPQSSKNFFFEIYFLVKTFFFVYLGLIITFSSIWTFIVGFILALSLYIFRPLLIYSIMKNDKSDDINKTYLEIMIPKGIAAAVLTGIVFQSGLFSMELAQEITTLVTTVIFSSILITSILLFLTQKNKFVSFMPFLHPKKENSK